MGESVNPTGKGDALQTDCPNERTAAVEETFSAAQKAAEARKEATLAATRAVVHPSVKHAFTDWLHDIFASNKYDAAVAAVVAGNVVLLIIETDADAGDREIPSFVSMCNTFVVAIFGCELCLKLILWRTTFFKSYWNLLDFVIVLVDMASLVLSVILSGLPSLSMLRILRLVRLARSIQFLMMFPELGLMMTALWGSLKALLWGVLVMMMVLVLYAILAVQLIHPINEEVTATGFYDRMGCERCPHAFESVYQSMLTFFQQLIAGDSWGTVSLPLCERSPAAWIFFSVVLVSLQLLVMNVILAAVVDAAQQARQENIDIIAQQKEEDRKAYTKHLIKLCEELDTDHSGSLTFSEVLEGFNNNSAFFNLMNAMDIQPDDISFVWGILDADGSGEVNYNEFSEELFKMKTKDERTMIMFIKYYVEEVRHDVRELKKQAGLHVSRDHGSTSPAGSRSCSKDLPSLPLPAPFQVAVPESEVKENTEPKAMNTITSSVDFSPDLKETLAKIEEKSEKTNQLVLSMVSEIPKREELLNTLLLRSSQAASRESPQLQSVIVSPQMQPGPVRWLDYPCCGSFGSFDKGQMNSVVYTQNNPTGRSESLAVFPSNLQVRPMAAMPPEDLRR
jgi:voltage-gated sodium channel